MSIFANTPETEIRDGVLPFSLSDGTRGYIKEMPGSNSATLVLESTASRSARGGVFTALRVGKSFLTSSTATVWERPSKTTTKHELIQLETEIAELDFHDVVSGLIQQVKELAN